MNKTIALALAFTIMLPQTTFGGNAAARGVVKTMRKRSIKKSGNSHYWRYALGAYCVWLALPIIKQCFSFDNTVSLLGHDPHVSDIPLAQETTKTPVITSMGLPDPAEMYAGKFDTKQSFTVTCRFRDTGIRDQSLNPLHYCNAFRSVSIGQESDAETLLYTVLRCYQQGHRTVHIFGNSRGGAVIIKMLDMISNPENYIKTWEQFGITDPTIIEEIKNMIGAGKIYLAHPLMNYQQTITTRLKTMLAPVGNSIDSTLNYIGPLGSIIAQGLQKTVYPLTLLLLYRGTEQLLKIATDYNPHSTDPLTIITSNIYKPSWPYNITIALAQEDEVVSNLYDTLLQLMSANCADKLSIEPGGANHRDIRNLIKQFRNTLAQDKHIDK